MGQSTSREWGRKKKEDVKLTFVPAVWQHSKQGLQRAVQLSVTPCSTHSRVRHENMLPNEYKYQQELRHKQDLMPQRHIAEGELQRFYTSFLSSQKQCTFKRG